MKGKIVSASGLQVVKNAGAIGDGRIGEIRVNETKMKATDLDW